MFISRHFYFAVIFGCSLVGNLETTSAAVVLDFDDLFTPGVDQELVDTGVVYDEKGFRISGTELSYLEPGNTNYVGPPTGTNVALFENDVPFGFVTLTNIAGDPFDLTSLDIAKLNKNGGVSTINIEFRGTLADGSGMVTETLSASGIADNEFVSLSFAGLGFEGLSAVSWDALPTHQFDNIVVTAVPEPTCLAFLGVGLGVAGIRRARRKSFKDAATQQIASTNVLL
ncbi:hypothetical protein [Rhodopirellula baltica]|uniref:hypothetical protein n=1 Tax=Rhodopirellula baltica TaxID=265606 RepID=UPI001181A179|nr:hypothetical protein [Rhodopirellula baltica]